jgi:type I restriction enzyme, S subunit
VRRNEERKWAQPRGLRFFWRDCDRESAAEMISGVKRKMNVPEGFKQTEVGVIPDDWDVKKMSDLSSMKSGEAITSKNIHNTDKYPCFGGNGLRGYTSSYTHHGDFALIGRQGALCGNVQFVAGIFFASEHAVVVTPQERTDIKWLYYMLLAMNLNQYAESSAQPGLSVEKINKLPIPIPPTKAEQTAIAAALSDMDALIEGVEKLLEKKRRIKQGAMQELLRPKEGWKIHKLDELCTPSKKRIDPKISQQVYKCVELEHIGQESGRLLGYAFTDELKSQKTLFNAGDTLFGKLRPYLKKFLFAGFDGCCTTEIWALQPANYIYGKLLFYIIQTDAVLEAANQSEGTKMPRADWKKVKEVKISIPPKPEQERIAAILSDMDSEIEQLETQLAKYRQLKTGMMQELLTGKKRLI